MISAELTIAPESRRVIERFARKISDDVKQVNTRFLQVWTAWKLRRSQDSYKRSSQWGGHAWAPLSPFYAAWKSRNFGGSQIGWLTGKLMTSFNQRINFQQGNSLLRNTVPYARYFSEGTRKMPARPVFPQINTATDEAKRQYLNLMKTMTRKYRGH